MTHNSIVLQHYIDWNRNGGYDLDITGQLKITWREDNPDWSNGYAKADVPESRIWAIGNYGARQGLELNTTGTRKSNNVDVYIGFKSPQNFSAPVIQKLLVSTPVGMTPDFGEEKPLFWTETGNPAIREGTGVRDKSSIYTEGPIYDLTYFAGRTPNGRNGVLRTRMLQGFYPTGITERGIVSRTRKLGDIFPTDGDGKVDLSDCLWMIERIGQTNTSADVAGAEEITGQPDGHVNIHDLRAMHKKLSDADKAIAPEPGRVMSFIIGNLSFSRDIKTQVRELARRIPSGERFGLRQDISVPAK